MLKITIFVINKIHLEFHLIILSANKIFHLFHTMTICINCSWTINSFTNLFYLRSSGALKVQYFHKEQGITTCAAGNMDELEKINTFKFIHYKAN